MIVKKIICVTLALLLSLTGCTVRTPMPEPTESFTQGIYEFTFSVELISGEPSEEWEFAYTYQGETISSGHQILFSLEVFTFHSCRVEVFEKVSPNNKYSATFLVAICDGGSGKTEVTVTGSDGETATYKITCQVAQVGKQ